MTNPAIEAVAALIDGDPDGNWDSKILAAACIAAVLDNLPRAEMEAAMSLARDQNTARIQSHATYDQWLLDAAISTARATLLPGDAT